MLVRDDEAGFSSSSPSCSSIFLATIFGQNKHTHMAPYCLLLLPACLPAASSCLAASLSSTAPRLWLRFLCSALAQSNPKRTHREKFTHPVYMLLLLSSCSCSVISSLISLAFFSHFWVCICLVLCLCLCLSSAHVPALCSVPASASSLPLPAPRLPTRLLWPYIVFSIEHFTY